MTPPPPCVTVRMMFLALGGRFVSDMVLSLIWSHLATAASTCLVKKFQTIQLFFPLINIFLSCHSSTKPSSVQPLLVWTDPPIFVRGIFSCLDVSLIIALLTCSISFGGWSFLGRFAEVTSSFHLVITDLLELCGMCRVLGCFYSLILICMPPSTTFSDLYGESNGLRDASFFVVDLTTYRCFPSVDCGGCQHRYL